METDKTNILTENSTSTKTVTLLSNGLLNLYEPQLQMVQKNLQELIEMQNKIECDLTKEIANFTDKNLTESQAITIQISTYKDKLQTIRKQMVNIHHRGTNLKKRALFIQEFKKKELAQKISKRQQEEGLIGKPSTTTNTPTD